MTDNLNPEMEVLEDEEFDGMITLQDEEGNDVEFEFVTIIEHEGGEYAILLPTDGTDEIVILQVEVDDDDEEFDSFIAVEDEAILQAVFDKFKADFGGEFDFAE
ncbi:MAG: DUF1292 domain-containing protein [Oscillospiraceae bacterium]|nr:DUF1292 domain-containing protein [Oscillospiraceae bacterium]